MRPAEIFHLWWVVKCTDEDAPIGAVVCHSMLAQAARAVSGTLVTAFSAIYKGWIRNVKCDIVPLVPPMPGDWIFIGAIDNRSVLIRSNVHYIRYGADKKQ